jgi:hypothetical protein
LDTGRFASTRACCTTSSAASSTSARWCATSASANRERLFNPPALWLAGWRRFKPRPGAAALAAYDYVFDFKDGKLIRLEPAAYAKTRSGI